MLILAMGVDKNYYYKTMSPEQVLDTRPTIVGLHPMALRSLSPAEITNGFFSDVSLFLERAVESGVISAIRAPLPSVLDDIDQRLHETGESNEPGLSEGLDAVLKLLESPSVQGVVACTEVEVVIEEGAITYEALRPHSANDIMAIKQQFLAKRAIKRAQETTKQEETAARRSQAFKEKREEQNNEAVHRNRQRIAKMKQREKSLEKERAKFNVQNHTLWSSRKGQAEKILNSSELEVLPHLHKDDKTTAALLGISTAAVRSRVYNAKEQLGLESRTAVAIWSLQHGVEYELPEPPPMAGLTLRERQVATRLGLRQAGVAEALGLSEQQVGRVVSSLLQKTGAANRTELALMAHFYGFEPLDRELDVPETLKRFTPFEQKIITRLHLPSKIIAGELSISHYAIAHAMKHAMKRAGVPNRAALALDVYKRGAVFHVDKPSRPFQETLTKQEVEIAKSLHAEYKDIVNTHNLSLEKLHQLVGYMKTKTGARTRIELMLMAHMYDTGEYKPIYHNVRPRNERLFEALGVESVSHEEVRRLLGYATPRQAEYIEAYYLSEEELSWRAIGEVFSVRREAAIQLANRGLARIRQGIRKEAEREP